MFDGLFSVGSGYLLFIDSLERVRLYKHTDGAYASTFFYTETGYVDINTYYKLKFNEMKQKINILLVQLIQLEY
jgi:hypothetical protein